MYRKRQQNNKKGVAIFFVLFLLLMLGTLIVQFFHTSRQAQSSVHRYQTSEMARQLASSAQEEAFDYLYKETGEVYANPENSALRKIPGLIIQKDSAIDLSKIGLDKRDSVNGIELEIPATVKMAEDMMPGRMDIKATARIIDFRNTDYAGNLFYDQEGIGTIEIAVTVKAKDQYKNLFPGACTIIRHHDYKVVSILSNKEKRDSSYAGNSYLDYVLFIRNGYDEFRNYPAGNSLNPQNHALEIEAEAGTALGKINLGSAGDKYVYLNISDTTGDFIENGKKVIELPELEANGNELDAFFPCFKESVKNKFNSQSSDAKFISLEGHKAIFQYQRLPITDDFYEGKTELSDARLQAVADAVAVLHKNILLTDTEISLLEGIKIKPVNRLSEILSSDLRKQFFNYGYFKIDLKNARIRYKVKKLLGGWEEKSPIPLNNPEIEKEYDKKFISCFNIKYNSNPSMINDKSKFDLQKLYEHITSKGDSDIASKAFSYVNDEYAYIQKDTAPIGNDDRFYKPSNSEAPSAISDPSDAHYPYSHFNLWTKRFVSEEELEKFGIYDRVNNKLHLRGVIHCNSSITLGNSSSVLEVDGNGVIIADYIKIEGSIKKKNSKDVFVLFTRKGRIEINTSQPIEAVLMAIGQSSKGCNIMCNETLNLKGALITDLLLLSKWKDGVTHKINYDEALNPNKDIYQIAISRRVTFERVIENESNEQP